MKLLKHLILIDKIQEAKSKIIIPKTEKEQEPVKGKVRSIGPDVKDIKVGNVVLFKKQFQEEYPMGYIVDERDILGIVYED